jgi:hypothetical protein
MLIGAVQVAACAPGGAKSATQASNQPARLERIDGSDVSRVILTKDAATRLDIKTEAVGFVQDGGKQRTVMPYSALVYDLKGDTWAYTSPEPLTFIRMKVGVESIKGNVAFLSVGPPSGTSVVTVGVTELFGVEFGIGK